MDEKKNAIDSFRWHCPQPLLSMATTTTTMMMMTMMLKRLNCEMDLTRIWRKMVMEMMRSSD